VTFPNEDEEGDVMEARDDRRGPRGPLDRLLTTVDSC